MIHPNMGIPSDTRTMPGSAVADALFSGTKQRVLALLFGQPWRSFYATEVIGLVGSGSGAVHRELVTLLRSGLISMKSIGNQKHYQANPKSPIFSELSAIVQKTIGLTEPLLQALKPLTSQIDAAFVYGSVAKRTDTAISDIDLMIITDLLTYGDVFRVLEDVGQVLGRPVNPTILTRSDYLKRLAANESFLSRVMESPKLWVVGGVDDLAT